MENAKKYNLKVFQLFPLETGCFSTSFCECIGGGNKTKTQSHDWPFQSLGLNITEAGAPPQFFHKGGQMWATKIFGVAHQKQIKLRNIQSETIQMTHTKVKNVYAGIKDNLFFSTHSKESSYFVLTFILFISLPAQSCQGEEGGHGGPENNNNIDLQVH